MSTWKIHLSAVFTSTEFIRMELGPDPLAAQQQFSHLALAVARVSCGCVRFPAPAERRLGCITLRVRLREEAKLNSSHQVQTKATDSRTHVSFSPLQPPGCRELPKQTWALACRSCCERNPSTCRENLRTTPHPTEHSAKTTAGSLRLYRLRSHKKDLFEKQKTQGKSGKSTFPSPQLLVLQHSCTPPGEWGSEMQQHGGLRVFLELFCKARIPCFGLVRSRRLWVLQHFFSAVLFMGFLINMTGKKGQEGGTQLSPVLLPLTLMRRTLRTWHLGALRMPAELLPSTLARQNAVVGLSAEQTEINICVIYKYGGGGGEPCSYSSYSM